MPELNREVRLSGFEKHFVDSSKDFHSKHGIIKKKDFLKKPGSELNAGKAKFILLDPVFLDNYKQIKRFAQIITLKDIGSIIANTGINKDSKVLDAGVGSGGMSCFLGMIAKKVVAYDVRDESLIVAQENVKSLCLKNVIIKKGSVYEPKEIKDKDFDVFVLDVPEPWKAIITARKVLKIGGFLAAYIPNVSQVQEFVNSLSEEFLLEKTIEVIEREWAVDAKRSRPKTKDHAHTAFLVFVRRLK